METQTLQTTNETDVMVSIGDVSKILGVPTHTIRYWEKEFPNYLEPPRTLGKQRRYGTNQITKLKNIVHMLKDEGYSIAGARRALIMQNREANIQPNNTESIDRETAERLISLLKQQIER